MYSFPQASLHVFCLVCDIMKAPTVLNTLHSTQDIPHIYHDIPPGYSRYPPTCIMVSPTPPRCCTPNGPAPPTVLHTRHTGWFDFLSWVSLIHGTVKTSFHLARNSKQSKVCKHSAPIVYADYIGISFQLMASRGRCDLVEIGLYTGSWLKKSFFTV